MSNEPSGASIDTPSVLEEALAAVRDRQAKYGPPGRHFARTAAMGSIAIRDKLRPGVDLDAQDWARLMICDKLCRDLETPIRDNPVDIAGYADCLNRVRNT